MDVRRPAEVQQIQAFGRPKKIDRRSVDTPGPDSMIRLPGQRTGVTAVGYFASQRRPDATANGADQPAARLFFGNLVGGFLRESVCS